MNQVKLTFPKSHFNSKRQVQKILEPLWIHYSVGPPNAGSETSTEYIFTLNNINKVTTGTIRRFLSTNFRNIDQVDIEDV